MPTLPENATRVQAKGAPAMVPMFCLAKQLYQEPVIIADGLALAKQKIEVFLWRLSRQVCDELFVL